MTEMQILMKLREGLSEETIFEYRLQLRVKERERKRKKEEEGELRKMWG